MNVAVLYRLELLASDVGRLRRHLEPESYADFLSHRIAGHVDSLDCMLHPTAADLYRECGDARVALAETDRHRALLHRDLFPRGT